MSQTAAVAARQDKIMEAVSTGINSPAEIMTLLDVDQWTIRDDIAYLMRKGKIVRRGRGNYVLAKGVSPVAKGTQVKPYERPPQSNDPPPTATTVENSSAKVELAPYLRGRTPRTVTFELDPTSYQEVVRLELQFDSSAAWIPIPLHKDTRVFMGSESPRWSASQEHYNFVVAVRVTDKHGVQKVFQHDRNFTVVVDEVQI